MREDLSMDNLKEVVAVESIRRITGYLTGTVDRFNDAKYAEVKDRTKNVGRIGFQADKNLKRKNDLEQQKMAAVLTAEK